MNIERLAEATSRLAVKRYFSHLLKFDRIFSQDRKRKGLARNFIIRLVRYLPSKKEEWAE